MLYGWHLTGASPSHVLPMKPRGHPPRKVDWRPTSWTAGSAISISRDFWRMQKADFQDRKVGVPINKDRDSAHRGNMLSVVPLPSTQSRRYETYSHGFMGRCLDATKLSFHASHHLNSDAANWR